MSKSFFAITVFFGLLVAIHQTEASVTHKSIFAGMNSTQNNPWDPRTHDAMDPTEDSGTEAIPEPEQTESDTKE